MLPVVLSIALLVLLSVAVITVVTHEGKTQPTSGRAPGDGSEPREPPEPSAPAAAAGQVTDVPGPEAAGPAPGEAALPVDSTPDLPRHRLRSAVLLVLYVLVAGVLMATAIGAVVAGLTVLLRDVVTS